MRSLVPVVYLFSASLVIAACGDDDGDNGAGVADAAPADGGDGTLQIVLAGENEVPAVATPASGDVIASLEGDVLTVTGEFSDLEGDLIEVSGSAAHVHRGNVGENGPIVFNLDVTSTDGRSGTLAGTFDLTSEQIALFQQGLFYVNVHTEVNPAGELRGQITSEQPSLAPVDATFDAELRPENETADVDSDASGTATAVVRGRELTLSGQFAGLTSPLMDIGGTPAHVHEAPAGADGPVVIPLSVLADQDMMGGRLSIRETLSDDELAALEAGDYYVNVHTEDFPAGEIRGQLIER